MVDLELAHFEPPQHYSELIDLRSLKLFIHSYSYIVHLIKKIIRTFLGTTTFINCHRKSHVACNFLAKLHILIIFSEGFVYSCCSQNKLWQEWLLFLQHLLTEHEML